MIDTLDPVNGRDPEVREQTGHPNYCLACTEHPNNIGDLLCHGRFVKPVTTRHPSGELYP